MNRSGTCRDQQEQPASAGPTECRHALPCRERVQPLGKQPFAAPLGVDAKARIAAVLARSPILDLSSVAEAAGLPLRRTRRLLEHLELQGAVLLHATPRRTTVHVLLS
jgi:hypothetical protein